MSTESLVKIWSPDDYHEVFERAATVKAAECAAALRLDGQRFGCDQTRPHEAHTSAALGASWVVAP